MNKPIFSVFEDLILGDKIVREYQNFVGLLYSNRCAFRDKYNENEKVIYLYPLITDGHDGCVVDPSADPSPKSFYDILKKMVLSEEIKVNRKITGGIELRQFDKDRKIFLNQLYDSCISLIKEFNKSQNKSVIKEHPVLFESLSRIKKSIHYHYEIAGIDLPTSISDPLTFQRKHYKVDSVSQDDLIAVVKDLINQSRFLNANGSPKPTTLRDEIIDNNLIGSADDISERALFDRIKDAIEEIHFYEVKSTS